MGIMGYGSRDHDEQEALGLHNILHSILRSIGHTVELGRTGQRPGGPMRRRGVYGDASALIAGGGLAIGMLVGVGGCESQPSRKPSAAGAPVNTGLGTIGNEHELTLPEQDELLGKDREQS